MAIVDSELLAEIRADIDKGLGARLITQRLNREGGALVESWMPGRSGSVDKESFLQQLSLAEAAALQTLIDGDSTEGKALKFKLGQSNTIDMSKTPNREFVTVLKEGGALSETTASNLLRLGEVRESRAQELWGEAVTIEQVRSVLGGV